MQITYTQGRKSLPVNEAVKAEDSQGASNCVVARLLETGVVEMHDTKTLGQGHSEVSSGEWSAFVSALR